MRTSVLLVAILLLETALRTATGTSHASGGELALDLLLRAARLAVLFAPIALAGVAWATVLHRRAPRLTTWSERGVGHLCATGPALRAAGLYALATVVATYTLARDYDLAWRAGAVFALAPLALAVPAELGVAAWRRRAAGPSLAGRLVWLALLAFLALLVLPRIQGMTLAVGACAVLAYVLVPTPPPLPRLAWLPVAVLVGVAAAGLVLEARRPGLRRLVAVQTPISSAGLALLLHVTDLDRDGSSGLFGLDCDDLDAERSPLLDDLPDDGVDQNCTGTDAARAEGQRGPGGPPAPDPAAPPPARRPDVYVVTVDALRADALAPALMPRTLAWSARCLRFTQARSAGNFTDFALFSLMTGLYPRHVRRGRELLIQPGDEARGRPSAPPLLASALRVAGWRTAAVLPLRPPRAFLFAGVDQGGAPRGGRSAPPAAQVLAMATSARARLAAPRFVWAHLLDTHAPYLGGSTRRDYERAVRGLDAPLADYLEALPADAIVVLTADHGEAFGEHGHYTHQSTLYDEEIRVPLLLCVPADLGTGAPRSIATPVSLVDVMPTLLELTGARAPYPRHGQSLVAHLATGAPLRVPWQLFEAWLPGHHLQGLQDGCLKYLRDLDGEWEGLYDVCADPGETRDLVDERATEVARLRARFFEILDHDLDAYRSWR